MHTDFLSPFPLREYQRNAISSITDAFFERGLDRVLVVQPTGAGKTVLFASLLRDHRVQHWLGQFPPDRSRVLIVAHRAELLAQAEKAMRGIHPDWLIEREQGARRASPAANAVLASVATVGRAGSGRLKALVPHSFRIVIIDEAHHSAARSYMSVLEAVSPKDKTATGGERVLVLGVTATPDRLDGKGLDRCFDEIVDEVSMLDLIDKKHLSPPRAYAVRTRVSLGSVGTQAGDFEVGGLGRAVDTQDRNLGVVKAYLQYATGRRAIAFAATIAHAERLAETLREHGVKAAAVHGRLQHSQRQGLLEAFARGDVQVLTNCNVLTEGYDAPFVSCIIQARPTQSRALYSQMLGRGLRVHPGKVDCVVLDFVDNWAKHPAVTTASLVGLPPELDLAGCDIRIAAKKAPAIWSREWRAPMQLDSLDQIEVFAAEVPLWKPRATMSAWREGPVDCFQTGVAELPGVRLVVWKGEDGWQARPIAKAREYRGQRVLPFLRVEKTGFSVDLLSTAGVVHPTKESAQKVMQETVREWTSGRERAVSSERAPSYLQGSADQAEWARHRLAAAATDGPLQGRSGTKVFLIDGNTFELYVRQKESAAVPLATVTYDEHGCDLCAVVSDEIQAHSQKFVTLHGGLLEFFAGEFTYLPDRHVGAAVLSILRRKGWARFCG